jgi:hypothetical protein
MKLEILDYRTGRKQIYEYTDSQILTCIKTGQKIVWKKAHAAPAASW